MDNQLRIIDNIKIIEVHDNVAMSGQLVCDCGCKSFEIFHTGKVTKGILTSYLIKKDKQIVIKAVCEKCGKPIIIYDSKIDGINPFITKEYLEEKFSIKNIKNEYEIIMKYNYYSKDFKSNRFVNCFIEIKNDDMKKMKQLYEG